MNDFPIHLEKYIEAGRCPIPTVLLMKSQRKYAGIACSAIFVATAGFPAVIIFALVGGTAYNEWSKAQVAQVAQARGDALLDALELEDEAEQAAALSAIAREDGDALVAKLLAAGVEADQAADLLRSVAADDTQPKYIRDLARLKMASTAGVLTLDEAAAILAELSEPGGVYRNVATELLVAVHLQRGETQAALELLQAHIKDAEASSEQIQRMGELIVALGASPELAN